MGRAQLGSSRLGIPQAGGSRYCPGGTKMKRENKNCLPVVYMPRKKRLIEILTRSEDVSGNTVVYYWFHFPYDWTPAFKSYDWEPVAYVYKGRVAVKVFWRPHYAYRCGRPVRLNGRPVVRISPYGGNAPRVTPFWDMVSIFDGIFAGYRRVGDEELERLVREGWPPEEQAKAEAFRRFVREKINSCSVMNTTLKAIVELLRAGKAFRQRDIQSMFRHTALAYLTAPKNYRTSDMGDNLLRSTIMLWAAHKLSDSQDFKRDRFFSDFEGFGWELTLHALLMIPLSLARHPRTAKDVRSAAEHYMKTFHIQELKT